jgi:hypothetical protein
MATIAKANEMALTEAQKRARKLLVEQARRGRPESEAWLQSNAALKQKPCWIKRTGTDAQSMICP